MSERLKTVVGPGSHVNLVDMLLNLALAGIENIKEEIIIKEEYLKAEYNSILPLPFNLEKHIKEEEH